MSDAPTLQPPRVGVLALQGDFEAHCRALRAAGAEPLEIRVAAQLGTIDGLVLPGGESTTMLRLLDLENLFEPLRQFGQQKPIFGTCAGAILLATDVSNPNQRSLQLMDMTVERNGYGRQVDSRIAEVEIEGRTAEAVFIRAPIIRRVGPDTKVLATYEDTPVLVTNRLHMAATFHPELSLNPQNASTLIHCHFVEGLQSAATISR